MIAEDYYFLQIIKKFYGGTLQMAEIWTMGEVLVEIMRPEIDQNFYDPAEFLGPYPSGAPAIFIDTAARLGHSTGIISKVGPDDFGRCIIDRLRSHDVNCDRRTPVYLSFVSRYKNESAFGYPGRGSKVFPFDGNRCEL